ncbi:hypothetical protein Tco_1188941 [Tanacetum coccineum]
MTTPIITTTSNGQMHNDIMAAGSKDRPPMLATGIYAQWQSRFMRYVDTKSNKKELKKCIFDGPYVMTRVLVLEKPATEIDPPVPKRTIPETYENTLPKNHAYINAEAKAIHLILTGIRDDIDSTVDACTTAKEMWIAIERLKPKRAKDYAYHKEKMLCKQTEKGVSLRVDQGDWLDDTNEETDKQELEAHYMYMAKIHEVLIVESGPTFDVEPLEKVQSDDDYNVFANERQYFEQPESINDIYVVEKVDSNVIPDSSDVCDNDSKDDQNAEEYEDECVVIANLIDNFELDTYKNKNFKSN